MSERFHFWLRVAALAAILAAEFGPRLWGAPQPGSPRVAPREAAIAVQR